MYKVWLRTLQVTQDMKAEAGCQSLWELLTALRATERYGAVTSNTDQAPILSVLFADDDERARKVISRSNYRMTGKFPSCKCGRMIHWESHLELKAFQMLEVCPWVKCYREQPAVIEFLDMNDIKRKHFPDIYIEMRNGTRGFLEIKPDREMEDSFLMQRTSLLKTGLRAMGYFYFLAQREQIESGHFLKNAQKLLPHARSAIPSLEMIRLALADGSLSVMELIQRLSHKDARTWIYSLVIRGVLTCDLSNPLTDETTINWNNLQGV